MAQVYCQAESSKTAASRALGQFDAQQLEDEITKRMAQFSSRQLEKELARRRNKRVRTKRAGLSSSREPRPGNNLDTPIDLTEDDVEWNVVMKIDNEPEDDIQADVKSEGDHESDIDTAPGADGENNLEAKVKSEREPGDKLDVVNGNDGGNDIRVKIDSESEGENEVELDSEAESEIDDENDFGDHFLAPVDDDTDTGMNGNMQSGMEEDDIQSGVEVNMENDVEDEFEYGIEENMEDDVDDALENNVEDEAVNEMGDGRENEAEDDIVQGAENDAEDVLENDVEDGIENDIEEDVEADMEGDSEGGKQPTMVKDTRGRGRHRLLTRQRKAPPCAVYKATVHSLAEFGTIRFNSSTADIDQSMMEKIKNCLSRGQHPSTPEAEAKRALLHAKVLMKRYNVSRAEVLAHEPLSAQKQYAGQSTVFLRRVDGNTSKPVQHQCFVDYPFWAMQDFFDCKVYTTGYKKDRPDGRSYRYSIEVTFYGIAENTIVAAMGFEMAYNLISEWSRSQKGKNCYCLGAAKQVLRVADAEKAEEESQAKKAESDSIAVRVAQEAAEEKATLARLDPVPDTQDQPNSRDPSNGEHVTINLDSEDDLSSGDGEVESHEDNDDDDDDMGADFIFEDDEMADVEGDLSEETSMLNQAESLISNALNGMDGISRATSPKSTRPSPTQDQTSSGATGAEQRSDEPADPNTESDRNWASHMQLTIFRANAIKIAEEYLKDKGTKLGKPARYRSEVIKDVQAYHRGQNDGKKIDVHQGRLKEA